VNHRPEYARRPWTDAERAALRRDYVTLGPSALGARLGRTYQSVAAMARDLGLRRREAPAPEDRDPGWVPSPGEIAAAVGVLRAEFLERKRRSDACDSRPSQRMERPCHAGTPGDRSREGGPDGR
jgi:hypothetical protein